MLSLAPPMTWYADLQPCDYFGEVHSANLRAIGWLQRGRPFSTGDADEAVLLRLIELTKQPTPFAVFMGSHECDLCRYFPEASGVHNLFIPGNGWLYVCPELICHYINAHGYAPPSAFCAAVLACPDIGTAPYKEAILANGARTLVREGLERRPD